MIQDLLSGLQKRELDKLESKSLELTEKRYPNLPDEIKRVAGLAETSEETVVEACVNAAFYHKDLEWHDVLDIVLSFYQAVRRSKIQK